MSEPVPAWKFWHPLPFWQVIVIAFVTQLASIFPAVALREGLGLQFPIWIANGAAGALMVVAVRAAAARRAAKSA